MPTLVPQGPDGPTMIMPKSKTALTGVNAALKCLMTDMLYDYAGSSEACAALFAYQYSVTLTVQRCASLN